MKRLVVNPGDRFGRLTVVSELPQRNKKRYFLCECECGNFIEARFVQMRTGRTKSCGCFRNYQNKTMNVIHGENKDRLYRIWHGMKQRCLNENRVESIYYLGKGISVCDEWMEYLPFREWALSNGYSDSLTIDRIDSNDDYKPENCRWVIQSDQTRNTSRNVFIEFNGEKLCVKDWANRIGISHQAMCKRLEKWPIGKALTTPKHL